MKEQKRTNKKYSAEYKLCVILDVRNNNLSYAETVRKYWNTDTKQKTDSYRSQLKLWERIFLEEGAVAVEKYPQVRFECQKDCHKA